MPKRVCLLVLLALTAAVLPVATAGAAPTEPYAVLPFVGVIKNNSASELSVPSVNSFGTLILPPRSWMEFVAWDARFDLITYRDGKPFSCHKIAVKPHAFPYMCKDYDFLVEINPPASELREEKVEPKYKKRVRKKRRA